MTRLKDFIDFALTLSEMEEVKGNNFPLPKVMVFKLNELNHSLVQRELHEEKGEGPFNPMDLFEMEVFGIEFKLVKK